MLDIQTVTEIFGDTITFSPYLTVSTETFFRLFEEAESFTYAALEKIDTENNYGYAEYIRKWKEQGLIE